MRRRDIERTAIGGEPSGRKQAAKRSPPRKILAEVKGDPDRFAGRLAGRLLETEPPHPPPMPKPEGKSWEEKMGAIGQTSPDPPADPPPPVEPDGEG